MANMGYCRFINTLEALEDCYEHLFDDDLSEDEETARENLVKVCKGIVSDAE